jgi:hypothetical protein
LQDVAGGGTAVTIRPTSVAAAWPSAACT